MSAPSATWQADGLYIGTTPAATVGGWIKERGCLPGPLPFELVRCTGCHQDLPLKEMSWVTRQHTNKLRGHCNACAKEAA